MKNFNKSLIMMNFVLSSSLTSGNKSASMVILTLIWWNLLKTRVSKRKLDIFASRTKANVSSYTNIGEGK